MKGIVTFIVSSLVCGVIGDDEKQVSVYEGESVTLHTDTEIQKYDKILWRFRDKDKAILLVQMIDYKVTYIGFFDVRFKDRLQISDTQSGDLTIKNMRIKHTGLYDAEINTATGTSHKRFNVIVKGVIGDEVKTVSVYEGESVTLHTDMTELQRDDRIYWRFRDKDKVILLVQMIDYKITYYGFNDERFKDRLQISDTHSGDLTIKNMRIKHTGLYDAEINTATGTSYKRFNVIVKESAPELTTGEVKSLSVTEGDSVTLQTDLTDIQRDAFILWRFGDKSVLIATCDKENNEISYGNDERFRDRLMLNDQTGDLTITNFINSNAGVYKLKISSTKQIIDKTFSVSVSGLSSGVIAGLCVFLLLVIVAVIAAGVILYRRRLLKKQRANTTQNNPTQQIPDNACGSGLDMQQSAGVSVNEAGMVEMPLIDAQHHQHL
ncbi:uncharacterized protein [Paramisgurnus dabryanus]|uniref:uncharacterized protein isoform X2 n=1 Tax=Paramisgurnus dabryanus TaxID=90735 RepID=UPI0031F35378